MVSIGNYVNVNCFVIYWLQIYNAQSGHHGGFIFIYVTISFTCKQLHLQLDFKL